MEDSRVDDSERKEHYGPARQPWDDIVDLGWAPEFAAANVLKYLRRTKDRYHSVESARWYYARLSEMNAVRILSQLRGTLTGEELDILR